jgi:DNA invertase Pin-like site-specific DNA recombinase
MVQTTFEMIREKYRKAQAERKRELERKRKKLIGPSKDDDDEKPPRENKELSVEEADKIIQLRESYKIGSNRLELMKSLIKKIEKNNLNP